MLVICIASSCTTKNAQEKGTKKKTHTKPRGAAPPPEKYASSQGKKRKKETNISKPRGVDHMQSNASLPPLLLFFPSKKDLHQARGGHHVQRNVSLPPRCAHANSARVCGARAHCGVGFFFHTHNTYPRVVRKRCHTSIERPHSMRREHII